MLDFVILLCFAVVEQTPCSSEMSAFQDRSEIVSLQLDNSAFYLELESISEAHGWESFLNTERSMELKLKQNWRFSANTDNLCVYVCMSKCVCKHVHVYGMCANM